MALQRSHTYECSPCAGRPRDAGRRAFALLALGAAPAYAQAPADGPSVLPLLLAFAFVLALIPAAVWFLKRVGAAQAPGSVGLRVVAQVPLGARERLVVVEAGDRLLVLGVTAHSIHRVGTLPKAAEGLLDPTPSAGFGSVLSALRRR
ncbi:MAG TPA: flagellar biosynthetic protein FliO [Burkholderiaceae bacterium]|jgi:flagellar protein FliO/FliZ|nr:flagellar biosynthetic protein FliO [Burkholderiaceae bacterium]